jgi:putative flippase GtrA
MRKELARFLVVGFTTVAIDYLVYRLPAGFGITPAPAKAAGFIAGTIFAYFANRLWTFGGQGTRPAPGSVLRFVALYAATLLCNVAVNDLLLMSFRGYPYIFQGAFVVATAVSASLNFLGMKFFVFRPQAPGS